MAKIETNTGTQGPESAPRNEERKDANPSSHEIMSASAATVRTSPFLSQSAAATIRAADSLLRQGENLKSMFSVSPTTQRILHQTYRDADAVLHETNESVLKLAETIKAAQHPEMAKQQAVVAAIDSKKVLDKQLEVAQTIHANLEAALMALTESLTYTRKRDAEIADATKQRDRTQAHRFYVTVVIMLASILVTLLVSLYRNPPTVSISPVLESPAIEMSLRTLGQTMEEIRDRIESTTREHRRQAEIPSGRQPQR